MAASDTVILLAFPRLTCLLRVIKRGFRGRSRTRPDLNPGCLDQLRDREFLSWIWNYPKASLPRVLKLLHDIDEEKEVVILRSDAEVEVEGYIDSLNEAGGGN